MLRKLFLCFVLIVSAYKTFAQNNDRVVAEVNGYKITKSELDKTYLLNKYVVTNEPVTMKKVLIDIINKKVGIKRAKENGLDKDEVVRGKMEEVLFHAQVSKDLEPKFKQITVTDKDVSSFYKQFPEYRTAHILLRVRVAPDKEEIKAAQNKIFDIFKELKKDPSKFAELANKYSQSPNAESGGEIGFKPAFFLAPEYFNAIKGKKIGHITEPVRTQFGYQIIKLLGVKKEDEISKPQYKKFVYDRKRDKIIDSYFVDLRKRAKIKIIDKNLM